MSSANAASWVWCGYPGHFIAAADLCFHLNTRIGDYRISTIGDYRPRPGEPMVEVGCERFFETMVFRVEGEGEHGNGEVADWSELELVGYQEAIEAEAGHMEVCAKYAAIAAAVPA